MYKEQYSIKYYFKDYSFCYISLLMFIIYFSHLLDIQFLLFKQK